MNSVLPSISPVRPVRHRIAQLDLSRRVSPSPKRSSDGIPLAQPVSVIGLEVVEPVLAPGRPAYFGPIDLSRSTQPEMDSGVARGLVAGSSQTRGGLHARA